MILTLTLMLCVAGASIYLLRAIERAPFVPGTVVTVRKPVRSMSGSPHPEEDGCAVCGGRHQATADDCPIVLSKMIYEKGMLFPRKRGLSSTTQPITLDELTRLLPKPPDRMDDDGN